MNSRRNPAAPTVLDQYHLIETVSANGQTLVARTIQTITTTVLRDGSFTVAFVGTDFLLPVPGVGVAFGSVGVALHFAAGGTLLEIAHDVSSAQQDFATIGQALAPPT
jgi:hypothetical protein